jgi:hypothetical protein
MDTETTNTGCTAMPLSVQADADAGGAAAATKDDTGNDAATATATATSTRPTGPTNNTWDGLVQQKLQLQACIDENNPSPSKLIYGTLPTLLKQVCLFESVEQSKQLHTIVQALLRQGVLLPYASLLAFINQEDGDPASSSSSCSSSLSTDTSQKLRTLQVQAMVRLQLWSSFGEAFAELYASQVVVTDKVSAKGKQQQRRHKHKKHKQKSVLPAADLLLQHTMQILSLTAFRLAPNRPFALFLQECLPKFLLLSSSSSAAAANNNNNSNNSNRLPRDTLELIFDNFEVPNPYLLAAGQDGDESAVATTSANFVPSPQRVAIVKKQKAAAKEALQKQKDLAIQQAQEKAEEKAKAKADSEKAHAAKSTGITSRDFIPGFPSSVSLTQPVVASRTKNSLLMGRDGNLARSRFVGSHFNTNLTNASTLFRQVQVSDRRQQKQQQQQQRQSGGVPANNNSSSNNDSSNKSQSLSRKRPVPSKSTSQSTSTSTSASALSSSTSGSNNNSNSKSRPKPKQNENAMPPPPPSISRRVLVHETPSKSKASVPRRNNIVLETPRQPARRNNSRIFATTTTGEGNDDNDKDNDKNQNANTGRPGESNASLVAQAFRAVQQRKR